LEELPLHLESLLGGSEASAAGQAAGCFVVVSFLSLLRFLCSLHLSFCFFTDFSFPFSEPLRLARFLPRRLLDNSFAISTVGVPFLSLSFRFSSPSFPLLFIFCPYLLTVD